jgi:hypothetical protein
MHIRAKSSDQQVIIAKFGPLHQGGTFLFPLGYAAYKRWHHFLFLQSLTNVVEIVVSVADIRVLGVTLTSSLAIGARSGSLRLSIDFWR